MTLWKIWSRCRPLAKTVMTRGRALAVTGLLLWGCSIAGADEGTPQIIRVEEDWILEVATPDPAANVPQIECVFGPADPNYGTYAIFEINHSTAPSFQAGGMQLQCWWQDSLLGYGNHPNNREFDAAVDTITFTTRTELKDHRLYLEIDDGDSVNWGSFGGQGYLRLSLYTYRENLNSYNTNHSIAHSRIAYGKNRVSRFARTEVRHYTSDGLHHTDEEDAVIYIPSVDDGGDGG